METSVIDFSPSFAASVFKFCVHLKVGKVYCVNENKDLPSFQVFIFFPFCRSYTIHMDTFSVKDTSATS